MGEKILIFRYWLGDNSGKIKQWLIYLLIATLSFGLGYLIDRKFSYAPIIIEKYVNSAE